MNYTYYRRYHPPKKRESFKPFFWLTIVLILAALVLKACIGIVSNIVENKRDEAILTLDKGQTEIQVFGKDEFEEASSSQIILEGDTIQTKENSYSTLEFYNGTKVKLDENTLLSFTEVRSEDDNDFIILDLKLGRVFVDEIPSEDGRMELKIRTDVMNALTFEGQYMLANNPNNEYLYVFENSVMVDFVDRSGGNETLIESANVQDGQRVLITDSKQRDLLNRLPVSLVENESGDFEGDDFLAWTMGGIPLIDTTNAEEAESGTGTEAEDNTVEENDEEPEETEETTEEEVSEEATTSLKISVDSPTSPASIQKDAIAIEGSIVSGTASKVTVTWGGGQPYTLAGFKAGDTSFRYVADYEYKNLSRGENIYTVIAYDADGNVSNTITVVVNATF